MRYASKACLVELLLLLVVQMLLLLLMGAWDCGPAALLQVVAQVKRRGCLHARTNRSMHLVSCWDGE